MWAVSMAFTAVKSMNEFSHIAHESIPWIYLLWERYTQEHWFMTLVSKFL